MKDKDIIKIALNYLRIQSKFLDILNKVIFNDDLHEIVNIEKQIKCDENGPFIIYRYVTYSSPGVVMDEDFDTFHLNKLINI